MIYHIFTHNHDEYTTNKKQAYECFELFKTEYGCARLYIMEHEDDNGECIEAYGEYPQ